MSDEDPREAKTPVDSLTRAKYYERRGGHGDPQAATNAAPTAEPVADELAGSTPAGGSSQNGKGEHG